MILKNFMIANPISVHPDDSLHHAAQIMAWTDTHHLPVTADENRLVGILSERDILAYRAQEPDIDPRDAPLSHAMKRKPQTASPMSSLTEAAARMAAHNIGCLPVTDKGKLIGLVTRSEVLSAEARQSMASLSTHLTAADVMTRDPRTVHPDDFLLDAVRLMNQLGVRHMPVVDEDGAAGILSDRDVQGLVRAPESLTQSFAPEQEALLVKDAMSRPPMRVWPDEDCTTVAELFVQFSASAMLVTSRDGQLEGIISYVDLLRSLFPRSTEEQASIA